MNTIAKVTYYKQTQLIFYYKQTQQLKVFFPKKPTLSVPKLPVYMSLPFMGDHSYHCKKQLSLLINKYFPQVDF